ncbi:hypothetical protein MRX96_010335 [Rhipicephalus microplus]
MGVAGGQKTYEGARLAIGSAAGMQMKGTGLRTFPKAGKRAACQRWLQRMRRTAVRSLNRGTEIGVT